MRWLRLLRAVGSRWGLWDKEEAHLPEVGWAGQVAPSPETVWMFPSIPPRVTAHLHTKRL